MPSTDTNALEAAAEAALRAPSIFNAQPWRWRVTPDCLELSADPERQLPVVDPEHLMTTLSCGIALHHARIALAAEGRDHEVVRLPDPARPELLARIRVTGHHPPRPADIRRYEATLIRHTDRRPFGAEPVSDDAFDRLRAAGEAERAHLYRLRADDVPGLAAAVSRAQAIHLANPEYRAELARWTNRPEGSGDGVPADTVTPPTRRTVPVREFDIDGSGRLTAGNGIDRGATYAVLAGDTDEPAGWLRAGESLSAILLAAVGEGLSVSPMSEVAEVPGTRALLRGVLAGIGYQFLVLRMGLADPASAVPPTPRREPGDAIDIDR
jgi:hypothetical protein